MIGVLVYVLNCLVIAVRFNPKGVLVVDLPQPDDPDTVIFLILRQSIYNLRFFFFDGIDHILLPQSSSTRRAS